MPRWWQARAKLNLYLHVVGRRADGYHLLDSLVAFADIADRIAAAPAPRLSLAIAGPFAGGLAANDSNNLVWRAADALARKLGRSPGAALTLERISRLPLASAGARAMPPRRSKRLPSCGTRISTSKRCVTSA